MGIHQVTQNQEALVHGAGSRHNDLHLQPFFLKTYRYGELEYSYLGSSRVGTEPRELFDTFDTRVSAKTGSKRNSRDSPPCPIQLDNLLDLALYQFDQDDLSIEAFEAIVRDRLPSIPTYTNKGIDGLISPCVSRSNAKHTSQHAKSTMGTLKILVLDSISTRQLEWRASELLSHAVEEVSIVERWNKRFRSYSLRWK
jgi:hypothetical protein